MATNEEVGDRLNLLMDHVDDIQVQNATQIFKDFMNLSDLNIQIFPKEWKPSFGFKIIINKIYLPNMKFSFKQNRLLDC